jgi:hypothetical protein
MTPDADASRWVKREITRAEDGGKPILPLLLAGQRFFSLVDIQCEDVTGGRMPTRPFVERLLAHTESWSNKSPVNPPTSKDRNRPVHLDKSSSRGSPQSHPSGNRSRRAAAHPRVPRRKPPRHQFQELLASWDAARRRTAWPGWRKTAKTLLLLAVVLGTPLAIGATAGSSNSDTRGRTSQTSSLKGEGSPMRITATPAPSPSPAPTNVTIQDNGGSLTLTWADPSSGKVQFIVTGGRDGMTSAPVDTVPAGRTTSTIYGLSVHYNYCFAVSAVWSPELIAPSIRTCTHRLSATGTP